MLDLKLLNKKIEYYEASFLNDSKLYVYNLKRHKLIEQFKIYVHSRTDLITRYEEKFSKQNNLDYFVKNCVIYSKEIEKSHHFINNLIEYFSLDKKLAIFLALLLKISSLKGMYAQVQLVLRLSQGCFLVKIPNFGVLVDQMPVRIKLMVHSLNNQDFLFSFLDNLSQVIDREKNLIGPKLNLADFK